MIRSSVSQGPNPLLYFTKQLGGAVVSCNTGMEAICRREALTCETKKNSHMFTCREVWEQAGCANVGKEPNACLWHRKQSLLGGNADWTVDGKSNSPTHDDAIPQSHLQHSFILVQASNIVVQRILLVKKIGGEVIPCKNTLSHLRHISTSTKSTAFTTQEQTPYSRPHNFSIVVLELRHHGQIQRVKLFGACKSKSCTFVIANL
mmetsp:Transcript_16208/g.31712  ORF Transcript_16208/g.31712 Transcript_16208/m.31712 type:complete len:205 (-) Transcript_16208:198-812(-)